MDELANVAEEIEFQAKFDAMLERWGRDDNYQSFRTYFVKMYQTQFSPQLWARCYVKDGGPRFNMAIENFHKQFKYYDCRQCRICRHTMMCSYPDRSGGHICKHLHAVVDRYPELKDRIPNITDSERMREMEWGHNLRPSKSVGFPPEFIIESMSDDEGTLPVAEEMPEFIYETVSDEDTGAEDQRYPTEKINPPEYDSDDPNNLQEELLRMTSN